MDPQQELFTALLTALRNAGYDVYDGHLPAEGTPYPFIYLADSSTNETLTKPYVIGEVTQSIHVYHNNVLKRGTVSVILLDIKNIARAIETTANFGWTLLEVNQTMLPDDTTDQPLLHGVIEARYKFT